MGKDVIKQQDADFDPTGWSMYPRSPRLVELNYARGPMRRATEYVAGP